MKIFYKKCLYEAVKVNEKILEITNLTISKLNELFNTIDEEDLEPSIYVGSFMLKNIIGDDCEFIINLNIDNEISSIQGVTYVDYKNRIKEIKIDIYLNSNMEKDSDIIDTYKMVMYHELLHVIDPKTTDHKISKLFKKKETESYYGYFNDVVEKDQFISSTAKIVQEKLKRDNLSIKNLKNGKVGKYDILSYLPKELVKYKNRYYSLIYYYENQSNNSKET